MLTVLTESFKILILVLYYGSSFSTCKHCN